MKPRIAIPVPTSTDAEYNRRSWPQYAAAVEKAGGEPVEVPLNQPPAATAKLIAGCQGILLPGSGADVNPQKYGQPTDPMSAPADPARENVDELLLQDAHNLRKPILTICFGTQMLNVWRGGSLIQHLDAEAPGAVNHRQRGVAVAHETAVAADSLLAESIAGGEAESTGNGQLDLPVNSSHHQAIDAPGDGLRVSARSSADGVVEAVENVPGAPGGFVLGVQWHPERTYDSSAASRAIFARFLSEASAWSPKPNSAASE
ncbi:MAG TPA: gamma-glutamyl-gamma-aminobutyrate hydrolase family protein [Acidobacteriaceae bacterium]|nr:gamma-glutamyl-gamma-aminobutyrate hydrolase family protein [Acidobacteriaceae bacterium]